MMAAYRIYLLLIFQLYALNAQEDAFSDIVGDQAKALASDIVAERARLVNQIRTYLTSPSFINLIRNNSAMMDMMDILASSSVSPECFDSLQFAFFNPMDAWATKLLDSSGKIPAGVTDGSSYFVGDFEMCMNNVSPSNYTPRTGPLPRSHYCRTTISAAVSNPGGKPPSEIDWGLCIPDTCSTEDFNSITTTGQDFFGFVNLTIGQNYCYKRQTELALPVDTIVMLVITATTGLLMFIGTLYDLFVHRRNGEQVLSLEGDPASPKPSSWTQSQYETTPLLRRTPHYSASEPRLSRCEKVLLAFSVISNGRKILDTNQEYDRLTCLDGIRFLSLSWVILGHTYAFLTTYANSLIRFYSDAFANWTSQVVIHADFSVDSFFLISGLLTTYIGLKQATRLGTIASKKFWFFYFFHRFWRLTPPYMLFLGFFTVLMRYFSNGPLWNQAASLEEEYCRKYWWYNLLYINNFLPLKQTCMSWTWYLANDMQFHVFVGTLVLPLMFFASRSKIVGFFAVLSVIGFILTSSISISVISRNKLLDFVVAGTNDFTYIQPWCRVAPYAFGLGLGYIIRKMQFQKWQLHPALVAVGWILAFGFGLSVIYGNSGAAAGIYRNSREVKNLYLSMSRVAWSLGMSWLIFACCAGYGGPINTFLSWRAFIPLSRLTYMAYIVHPIVIYTFYGSLRQAPRPSVLFIIQSFISNLVMSYLVALVFSLSWELPTIGLEKVFSKK